MSEIDARGLPCPQPVIQTKKALEEIESGQVTVLVDSPESCENVRGSFIWRLPRRLHLKLI